MLKRALPEQFLLPYHLGRFRHIHPRLHRLPLHPHLPNTRIPQSLLPDPHNQSRLLRWDRPRQLLHLPAHILSMGTHDWRNWILWSPEIARPLHWDIQPSPRRHGRGVADAGPLGTEDGRREEGDAERYVWHGHCVCSSTSRQYPLLPTSGVAGLC